MLDRDRIYGKIDLINRSLTRLKAMAELGEDRFTAEPDNFAIAEHHVRRSLECVFDIGRHIMAKKGLGHPADYRSVISVLGREGVIPWEFSNKIKGMAGYRNRLVHGYAEVTPREMYRILKEGLGDLEAYCRYIIRYIESEKA
ncbi:MAG: DUF86 domain-containing protein [Peptococcaceae bacterium]|nr:DUF86 domain-containing protein [Peptococcaceae bacterium]